MSISVAKPYARALFQNARDEQVLDEIREDLNAIDLLLKKEPAFKQFIMSPIFDKKEERETMHKLFEGKAHPLTMRLLDLLIEKGRLPVLHHVTWQYEELYCEATNRLKVLVTFAMEPDQEQLNMLKEKLSNRFGKLIELAYEVNPDIIGGFIVHMDNELIDYSIASKLNTYKRNVINV